MEDAALSEVVGQVTTPERWQQATIPYYTMSTGGKAPLFHVINHRSMERTGWQGHHLCSPTAGATTKTHMDLHRRSERSSSVYQRESRDQGHHIRP